MSRLRSAQTADIRHELGALGSGHARRGHLRARDSRRDDGRKRGIVGSTRQTPHREIRSPAAIALNSVARSAIGLEQSLAQIGREYRGLSKEEHHQCPHTRRY